VLNHSNPSTFCENHLFTHFLCSAFFTPLSLHSLSLLRFLHSLSLHSALSSLRSLFTPLSLRYALSYSLRTIFHSLRFALQVRLARAGHANSFLRKHRDHRATLLRIGAPGKRVRSLIVNRAIGHVTLCSIAFLLASLVVHMPPLSFLYRPDCKHCTFLRPLFSLLLCE
jgi:hypothetical protein